MYGYQQKTLLAKAAALIAALAEVYGRLADSCTDEGRHPLTAQNPLPQFRQLP
jgi:hypothetical protein